MALFSPADPTPAMAPTRELLVNNVRSQAMARTLLREALLADVNGKATHEQKLMLKVARKARSRTRALMREPGA